MNIFTFSMNLWTSLTSGYRLIFISILYIFHVYVDLLDVYIDFLDEYTDFFALIYSILNEFRDFFYINI